MPPWSLPLPQAPEMEMPAAKRDAGRTAESWTCLSRATGRCRCRRRTRCHRSPGLARGRRRPGRRCRPKSQPRPGRPRVCRSGSARCGPRRHRARCSSCFATLLVVLAVAGAEHGGPALVDGAFTALVALADGDLAVGAGEPDVGVAEAEACCRPSTRAARRRTRRPSSRRCP